MKINVFLLMLIAFAIASCKKKSSSFIVIGSTTEMEVKSLNINLVGGNSSDPAEEKIDLNNDGNIDISFFGKRSSSGTGVQGELSIQCQNPNLFLKGEVYDDTTFVKVDTTIHKDAGLVYVEVQKQYYYTRQYSNDSLVSLNHYPFRIRALEGKTTLQTGDNFMSVTDVLQYNEVTSRTSYYSKNNDTVTNVYTNPSFNPRPFPWNKELFIGFKIVEKKEVRLGWIKLIILDKGELQLIETAIQKN